MTTHHGVTGAVKNVDAYRITNDLDADHMVLLSQICFSVSEEILYCEYVIFFFFLHNGEFLLFLLDFFTFI